MRRQFVMLQMDYEGLCDVADGLSILRIDIMMSIHIFERLQCIYKKKNLLFFLIVQPCFSLKPMILILPIRSYVMLRSWYSLCGRRFVMLRMDYEGLWLLYYHCDELSGLGGGCSDI